MSDSQTKDVAQYPLGSPQDVGQADPQHSPRASDLTTMIEALDRFQFLRGMCYALYGAPKESYAREMAEPMCEAADDVVEVLRKLVKSQEEQT